MNGEVIRYLLHGKVIIRKKLIIICLKIIILNLNHNKEEVNNLV